MTGKKFTRIIGPCSVHSASNLVQRLFVGFEGLAAELTLGIELAVATLATFDLKVRNYTEFDFDL